MHIIEKRIEIRAPIERVFDFFSDFESFPKWMKNIREVRYTGRRFTRWSAEAPLGTEVEWEAETTRFEPEHLIAWRSVRGDLDTEGEVVFEETRRGTTLVRVVLGYALPAGRFGEIIARLFGKNPERQLEDDLERFAAVIEGRRRSAARRERNDEDERDERRRPEARADITGPRDRRPRDVNDDERGPRFDERRSHSRRVQRGRDYYTDADERRVREDEIQYRERERRMEFEEAIRAAQRSQRDDQRRYAAQRERRERDDEYRYRDEREYEQRAGRSVDDERYARNGRRFSTAGEHRRPAEDERVRLNELWDETGRREASPHDEERGEPRPRMRRHALTPREREMEQREERNPDYGYTEQAFRRGVDKLMDEGPSRRWRRWE
ncbi:MAG TPA: SRPBCC family protein [Pyrinomonadaceae bacterium]|jgi:uncharacterized protein YndB with AHSA1/START domain